MLAPQVSFCTTVDVTPWGLRVGAIAPPKTIPLHAPDFHKFHHRFLNIHICMYVLLNRTSYFKLPPHRWPEGIKYFVNWLFSLEF